MPDSPEAAVDRALVDEATRKAGLVWLAYAEPGGQPDPRPAWHVWHEGAAYVVCGGAEQVLPGLADAAEVTVVVPSKDTGARVVSWTAVPTVLAPTDDGWAPITTSLAAKRLNAEGGAPMIERWARESTVVRLTPTGAVPESAIDPPADSLARIPRDTPATTLGRQPRMIGGVPRRRR